MSHVARNVPRAAATFICHAPESFAKMAVSVQKDKYFIMKNVFRPISALVIVVEEVTEKAKRTDMTVIHG